MQPQGTLDSSCRHARIRNAVAWAVLAIPLMAARPAAAPLDMRLHIDASLRTNAVYHLACLAGSISCSRDIFERFWKDRLHESIDDRQTVAGALVDGQTVAHAKGEGLDPAAFLAENDSTGFFARLGGLLRPGPTYTNVNDFRAILVDRV